MMPLAVSRFSLNHKSFKVTVKKYDAARRKFKNLRFSCTEVKNAVLWERFRHGAENNASRLRPGTNFNINSNNDESREAAQKARSLVKSLWQWPPDCVLRSAFREIMIKMFLLASAYLLMVSGLRSFKVVKALTCQCTLSGADGDYLSDDTYYCTRTWSYHGWLMWSVYAVISTLCFY